MSTSSLYDRLDLLKAAVAGFLSGSRGSLLIDGVRQNDALLRDMAHAYQHPASPPLHAAGLHHHALTQSRH